MNTPKHKKTPELELSPMSRKVRHFDKYSRKGGCWSWKKRPSYERDVVNLVKAERRIEDGIASALTEVEAVEAGLRYFDEIIMPENKFAPASASSTLDGCSRQDGQPPATVRGPSRIDRLHQHQQEETSPEVQEAVPSGHQRAPRRVPASTSKEYDGRGRGGGGFSRPQGTNRRDYDAARKRRAGGDNKTTNCSNQAISECVDLKLTLKQRLDNYDRQRGINLKPAHEDAGASTPSVPVIEDKNGNMSSQTNNRKHAKSNPMNGGRDGVPMVYVKDHSAGVIAPCCDGGALDTGSVGRILARSLGNTSSAVRRNKAAGQHKDGHGKTHGNGAGTGGGNDYGNNRSGSYPANLDDPARQLPWQSWNEPPPPALLSAKARSTSVGEVKDDKRRHPPPPEVVAEIVRPPLQGRRRLTNATRNCTASERGSGSTALTPATLSPCGERTASPGNEIGGSGSNGGGAPSPSSSASLRRATAGGASRVPRVAMLATAAPSGTDSKSHGTQVIKRGKLFDPDQLECVRRHEASVAERERRVRSLRSEAEKKSLFRARPLPSFLGNADDDGTCGGRGGGGSGARCQRGSGVGGRGVTGTPPELLAALEKDEEARALVEKIRKINPSADIASIVLRPASRSAPLPLPPRSRVSSGHSGGTARSPPSQRAALTAAPVTIGDPAAAPTTASVNSSASRLPVSEPAVQMDASPTWTLGGLSPPPAVGVPSGGSKMTTTLQPTSGEKTARLAVAEVVEDGAQQCSAGEPQTSARVAEGESGAREPGRERRAQADEGERQETGEEKRNEGSKGRGHSTQTWTGSGRSSTAGSEISTPRQEDPHVCCRETAAGCSVAAAPVDSSAFEQRDLASSGGTTATKRRSLMGRMLESGMLERQREWAKARSMKVLESRRQLEEAKAQEGKGDIVEAGLSGRSWSKAKTEHQRSLQRQMDEEATREQTREARRQASLHRAEREREFADRRAAQMAEALVDTVDVVGAKSGTERTRESTTTPSSKEGVTRRRSRRQPRRSRNHSGGGVDVINGDRGAGSGIEPAVGESEGNGRLQGCDEGRRTADESGGGLPVADGGKPTAVLSEDSFYRVAVEKIMERERLGQGNDEAGGIVRDISGEDENRLRRGKGGAEQRRPRIGAANATTFAVMRGSATQAGAGSKESAMAARNRRATIYGVAGPVDAATMGRRFSDGKITTKRQGCHRFPGMQSKRHTLGSSTTAHSRELVRTSSILSLYESQSVEQVAGERGACDDLAPRDDSRSSWDGDMGVRFHEGGCMLFSQDEPKPSEANEAQHASSAAVAASVAGQDGPVARRAAAKAATALLSSVGRVDTFPTNAEGGPYYPSGDGGRELLSRGSGGGVPGPEIVRGSEREVDETDSAFASVGNEPAWNEILQNRRENYDGTFKVSQNVEEIPQRRPRRAAETVGESPTGFNDRQVQCSTTAGSSGESTRHRPVPAYPYPSPRKRCSRDRSRRLNYSASTEPMFVGTMESIGTVNQVMGTPPFVDGEERDMDDGGIGAGRRDYAFGAREDTDGRLRLRNVSEEENVGVERVYANDRDNRDETDSRSGSASHGIRQTDGQVMREILNDRDETDRHPPSSASAARESLNTPQRAFLAAATTSIGSFFDAATSSADKGRFKVRDPRLFDPCSMRRRPDHVVKSTPVSALAPRTGRDGHDRSTSPRLEKGGATPPSTGVTLLLGRRINHDDDSRGNHIDPAAAAEQVITVMFDRSKFNEQEAKGWWIANRTRIEHIGDP